MDLFVLSKKLFIYNGFRYCNSNKQTYNNSNDHEVIAHAYNVNLFVKTVTILVMLGYKVGILFVHSLVECMALQFQ